MLKAASLEGALEIILSATIPLSDTITVPIIKALGQVSSQEVAAKEDNPPFDRSPLDGFALRSEDTVGASLETPVRLKVIGTLYAGAAWPTNLNSGEALRLMTGAPMPGGSDCVTPKEDVLETSDEVLIYRPLSHHQNYVFRGEDIRSGHVFLRSGTKLDSPRLGMMAAMGLSQVQVYKPPIIGLCSIGDELAEPGSPLAPGMIYNSNGTMLMARLFEYGFPDVRTMVLQDDPEAAAKILDTLIKNVDVLITIGSVSVGDKDIMGKVFDLLGLEKEISGLNFKPGHAFLTGLYQGKRILCLSGNPFAALATLELVGRPVLAKLSHRSDLSPRWGLAQLTSEYKGGKGRNRRFLRGRLTDSKALEMPSVDLPLGHDSGRLFSLTGCNCLVDVPPDTISLSKGETVNVLRLNVPTIGD